MIGQLVLVPRGRGQAVRGRLYGLPVLRAEADLSGFFGERRLCRAGRELRRGGVARLLAPPDFSRWSQLERFGLRPVNPESFVQSQAVPLALRALERQGLAPDSARVALRGRRADRAMARTAARLCLVVRGLVIDAPQGGPELAGWLRREFGVPVLPREELGQVALTFQAGCPGPEKTALELFGPRPGLAGLSLTAPGLAEEDRGELPLLAALWEGGKLLPEDIKIT